MLRAAQAYHILNFDLCFLAANSKATAVVLCLSLVLFLLYDVRSARHLLRHHVEESGSKEFVVERVVHAHVAENCVGP